MSVKKIGVTGMSGFVGQSLRNYFADSAIKLIELNVREGILEDQIYNLNGIIHLAGKAHDTDKSSNPSEYYKVNYEGTKKIFDTFLNSEVNLFIFLSSVKAVRDTLNGECLLELHNPSPQTDYGKSKLLAETYILENLYRVNKSQRVFILRPCMIHGPGNKGNLNHLYNAVSKHLPWPLGAFRNKRSFCSIENLAFVIKEFIERQDIASDIFNIADNEPLSTNEVISIIGESLNRKPLIWKVPIKVVKLIARMGDIFHFPLNSERLKKLTENYEVSNFKLLNILGKELPKNTREGLLRTFQSFKRDD